MQAVVFYGACRDLSRIEKRRMRCRGAGIGGVSVLFMTDEKVLFPVRKERSGHGISPAECPGTARRYTVTRIRFYYRTISAPALQETGLLSHRLFLSFRKKAARIYRNRFKNACVRLSPAFRQRDSRFSVCCLLV